MTFTRRIIWSACAALALAPPAGHAAGSGSTAERHQMSMYKVEEDLSLDAVDIGTTSLSCRDGDYAVDGMWRIAHTDFNPQLDDEAPEGGWNAYNGIQPWDSHSVGASTWRFTLYNDTSETAQVKLYVTCLNARVAPADRDAHTHRLTVGPLETAGHTLSATSPAIVQAGDFDCPAPAIAVAPGFEVTRGDLRVFRSAPAASSLRAWEWGFYPQAPATRVTTSIRCLRLASTADGATRRHFHRLVVREREGAIDVPADTTADLTAQCSPYEKGLIGIFDVRPDAAWTAPMGGHRLWYLGMEPQIKSRVFKVWDTDADTSWAGRFGLVCVNDRIGRRVLA